ncbi:hypothetical protein NDU88_001888 [Pleurodeles waltl]|uniref:Uncharacterized protein n=1 Tax=Pleurodeles waltl TaxID=8319 RepID=A0AAV7SAY5_PLEWA|nr:hypothetical protein NDU88_001888 [Pleurodeles waltl]
MPVSVTSVSSPWEHACLGLQHAGSVLIRAILHILAVKSDVAGSREGQTKEKKYFYNGAGDGVQEAEEEEPGSKDMGKEKKSSGKQV